MAESVDQHRDQPGPPGLMTRADAGAIVAVEIFVKEQMVAPMRIILEPLGAAKYASAIPLAQTSNLVTSPNH
jgi:hypothetical protein